MFYIERYPSIVPPMIVFLLAFFISVNSIPLLRRLALRTGIVDRPCRRKPQRTPVPCLGGIGIVLAVTISLLLTYGRSVEVQTILYVGLGIAAVGLLDDVFGVRATVKLLVLAAACYVLHRAGLGLKRTPFATTDYLLTFLWVAGVSSAFNAVDNSDGLAGGICLVSAVSVFLLGWSSWQLQFSFLAMSLAGGAAGFLHHNLPPARVYMGDAGSFYLGYILSVLVIFGQWSDDAVVSLFAGCMVIGLPIYDLSLTTALRVRHGIVRGVIGAIAYSDRDHLSHRLLSMGFTHGRMLATLLTTAALCSAVAAAMVHVSRPMALLAAGVVITLQVAVGVYIDRRSSRPELWVNGRRSMGKAFTAASAEGA